MKKWLRYLTGTVCLIFCLVYFGAKTHFFTRHHFLTAYGTRFEEHWPWWADIGWVSIVVLLVDWISEKQDWTKDLLTGERAKH